MNIDSGKVYTSSEFSGINALDLAFVGDAVFTLFVRERLLSMHNTNVNMLTKLASKIVNAGNQYKLFREIEPTLTAEELEVAKRARNSNIHTKAKNYSITEYIYATAYEAVLGYLYLCNNTKRLNEILEKSMQTTK